MQTRRNGYRVNEKQTAKIWQRLDPSDGTDQGVNGQ
jgi:hypothetical protein